MAIKKSELYSSLWKSCDELRGGMDASQPRHIPESQRILVQEKTLWLLAAKVEKSG
jgi:type I restriction-modification system DNA methylase subunit